MAERAGRGRGAPLRVLHCVYDDAGNPWLGGGGARRVFELYRRLGDEVAATVATGNYPGATDGSREGVRYRHLGVASSYAASRASYVAAAQALLLRTRADVLVYDYSLYTPLRLPRGRPTAIVVHMLQSDSARQRWGPAAGRVAAAAERRLLGQSRWLCPTSEWLRDRLRGLIAEDVHLEVIGSGVGGELFELEREERDYLLCYGRFDVFQKGLDTLLHGFVRLVSERPQLRLRIAGRGKDEPQLRELIHRLGLEERVDVIAGVSREQRDELFAGARLLLMPSRLEGLPMVPAEAMAAALPVVAADVGAVREVVQPPRGGLLVPPDDAAALASAADRLLGDESLRRATSASAREAAERFRWSRVARRHLALLQRAAGRAGID